VLGGIAFVLLPVLAVAGLAGGVYLTADVGSLLGVMLGAVIALVVPIAAGYVWRKAPWKRLIADPLARYEWSDGPQDINAVIRPEDFLPAFRALRHAKLNPIGSTQMPTAPPDAPGLTCKLIVGRSAYHWPEGSPELIDEIRHALDAAGIRARVGGVDVNADA
jgi:hypothetical protein